MVQPRWRMIDQTLEHLRGELVKHPAFTAGAGGPNVGSSSYNTNWAKLDRYRQTLTLCLRDLKSSAHLLHSQSLAARKVPREHRYSVNQSLRARQSNIEHVREKAEIILDLLIRMSGDYAKPDFGSLNKLMDQGQDALEAIMLIKDGPDPIEPGISTPASPSVATPLHTLVALIVFYLVHMRNRRD